MIFATAVVVASLLHWLIDLIVIGFELMPAVAAEVCGGGKAPLQRIAITYREAYLSGELQSIIEMRSFCIGSISH